MKRLVIVGAGISGLCFAYYFQKKHPDCAIIFLEKSPCVGGWLQTCHDKNFSYEKGPRFFAKHKAKALLSLIEELDLASKILYAEPCSTTRFIYEKQVLHPFPSSLREFLFSPLTKGIPKAFFQEVFRKKAPCCQETVEQFLLRRFRCEKLVALFNTMTKGIYATDIKNLSMQFSFPAIASLEENYGSVVLGMLRQKKQDKRLFTLEGGIGQLAKTLERKIKAQWHFSTEAYQIADKKVFTNKGCYEADHIVLALPFHAMQQLYCHEVWSKVPMHSIHVVHMQFPSPCFSHKGFGYLTSSNEKTPVLGAVFDSCMYPKNTFARKAQISVFMGGQHYPHLGCISEQELQQLAYKEIQKHLGIKEKPTNIASSLGKNASIVYGLGHEQILSEALSDLPDSISLIGNYLQGVSVDHCIQNAIQEVEKQSTRLKNRCL